MHGILSKYIVVPSFFIFGSIIILFVKYCTASENVMQIHFRFDEYQLPMANIEINNRKHEFMIDTGSNTALHLTKDTMSEISQLVIKPDKERSIDLAGKVIENDKFNISRLFINGMLFKNINGVSLTPWGIYLTPDNKLPTSMVIGLDLFKERAVLIDYKSQRFSVSHNLQTLGINLADGWLELPFRLSQEGILIKVSQNAQPYTMVLDTGATVSVFWKERLKSRPVEISCLDVLNEMDNDGCNASTFQLEDEVLGKININAVILDGKFDQIEADGLIGNNFFQKYAVLIDFPGNKLFIKPNS